MPKEIWKEHEEGRYAVSNLGRIKDLEKDVIKTQYVLKSGYAVLTLEINERKKLWRAHKFIALVWNGKRPRGKQINHKDGDKTNNKPKNLEYVTAKQNVNHALETGLRKLNTEQFSSRERKKKFGHSGSTNPMYGKNRTGENGGNVALTWTKVHRIRKLRTTGKSLQKIADRFGVTKQTIALIVKHKTWREE